MEGLGYQEQHELRQWLLENINRQLGEVEEEMGRVQARRDEAASARRALEQIEAALARMSSLAREAAAAPPPGPELVAEFEACKALIEELSAQATVGGVNLIRDGEDEAQRAIGEIIGQIDGFILE